MQDNAVYEVVEEREDTGAILAFLINHMKLGATVIAGIHIDRWRIEFLRGLQAKSEDQYVRGHVGQGDESPDLHSIDPGPRPHTDCP